jgi:hypothetical protein
MSAAGEAKPSEARRARQRAIERRPTLRRDALRLRPKEAEGEVHR